MAAKPLLELGKTEVKSGPGNKRVLEASYSQSLVYRVILSLVNENEGRQSHYLNTANDCQSTAKNVEKNFVLLFAF